MTKEVFSFIGRGSFASVNKASFEKKDVVVKVLHWNLISEGKSVFTKEAKILGHIDHINIVKLIGVCEKPLSIVMEYAEFTFLPFG